MNLRSLSLCRNALGDEGATIIAAALSGEASTQAKLARTLTGLQLDSNEIGEGGSMELAQMLRRNHTLETLSLSMNSVGGAAACEFAAVLEDCAGIVLYTTHTLYTIHCTNWRTVQIVGRTGRVVYVR
jgi:hypothetical protein